MSEEGAVVVEGEDAAVPLHGVDHSTVGVELLQGLLSEPKPYSGTELQNGDETILFLRVQHAESLLALITAAFPWRDSLSHASSPFMTAKNAPVLARGTFSDKKPFAVRVPQTHFAWENWT